MFSYLINQIKTYHQINLIKKEKERKFNDSLKLTKGFSKIGSWIFIV